MPFEDDDEGFDPEELSEEEKAEILRKSEEEDRKAENHPLNVQANEIMDMVTVLVETRDGGEKERCGSLMMESAMIICAKLASALRTDAYLIAMQNAAIIREHAEYLRLSNHMMTRARGFDPAYVRSFRQEMEEFRKLFKEWVTTFDQLDNDYEDEWGLFGRR
jgi:hypothetical protein